MRLCNSLESISSRELVNKFEGRIFSFSALALSFLIVRKNVLVCSYFGLIGRRRRRALKYYCKYSFSNIVKCDE